MARRRGVRRQVHPDGARRPGVARRTAAPPDGRPLSEQVREPRLAVGALLPLRFFFGATFLYAGLDKLVSPTFFRDGDPASITAQFEIYARTSPIGGLARLALPVAPEIGFLIAVAEIGIGLGALSGLAFRIAAVGGAALSLLFWLTASWATKPYYYGPDLPYLAGWIVLAIAGHGGVLVPRQILEAGGVGRPGVAPGVAEGEPGGMAGRQPRADGAPSSPERRALIQAGILGALAVIVASFAGPLRTIFGGAADDGTSGPSPTAADGSPAPTPAGSTGQSVAPGASSAAAGNIPIATVADVDRAGSVAFQVPMTAPSPLPAGDPGVLIKLPNGSYVAFDAVCTHAGCTVEWDAVDGIIVCPCHGAEFDATAGAAVIAGPTDIPLTSLPLVIDSASGQILLKA